MKPYENQTLIGWLVQCVVIGHPLSVFQKCHALTITSTNIQYTCLNKNILKKHNKKAQNKPFSQLLVLCFIFLFYCPFYFIYFDVLEWTMKQKWPASVKTPTTV